MGREASKKTRKRSTAKSGGEAADGCMEIKISPSDAAKIREAVGDVQNSVPADQQFNAETTAADIVLSWIDSGYGLF